MSSNVIKVTINGKSIRKEIDNNINNPFDAFNEYVWNALDAKAKDIKIELTKEKNDIKQITVQDDGEGINYYEVKETLFGKFNASQKIKKDHLSLPRGKNGFGRFSFYRFASKVKWITVFEKGGNKYEYEIEMVDSDLTQSHFTEIKKSDKPTGTTVIFSFEKLNLTNSCTELLSDNKKEELKELKKNLSLDFAWIIELFDLSFKIDGRQLDYADIVEEKDESILEIREHKFKIKFIKWKELRKDQYSRYYLLNSKREEVYNNTTTLNNKGDEFYHSIYVESEYFDEFDVLKTKTEEVYKELLKKIDKILAKKKKPYLDIFVENKLKKLKEENVLPSFDSFEKQIKQPIYEKTLKKVIAYEPRLLANTTNVVQKKIFLKLLSELLDDENSRDNLRAILSVLMTDDNADHLEELKRQLEEYGLENILGTIKEIENRLQTIKKLKNMINNDFKDYSEKDIQKMIEKNYWIFGEEYNLMIVSENENFTKLRKIYREKILKLKSEQGEDDKSSEKKVDLFICADTEEGKRRKHLIVEIKKPELYLKRENYWQIETYKDEISKIPEFNSTERHSWNYILLYRDISKDHANHFKDKIRDKFTGKTVDSTEFFKIFVVKWADLLEECEFKMKYLRDRLELRKNEFIDIEKKKDIERSPLMKSIKKKQV